MKKVDFSSKHDIYIRNFDGSYQPMDEPFFEAEMVARETWKILSDGDYSYLIAGDESAIVVDTGYGAGNIKEFCETLTEKSIIGAINTHHHFDHSANNCYFDQVFMDEKAVALATIPYPSFEGMEFPRDYKVVTVADGYTWDLGNRTLEVFQVPDHTPDGICILDRKEKLLFSGDEFMNSKNLSVAVEQWKNSLEKLMAHRSEFEQLCAGEGVLPADIVDKQYRLVNAILAGEEGELMMGPGGPGGKKGPGGPEPKGKAENNGKRDDFDPRNPQPYMGHKVYYRKFPHPEDVQHQPRKSVGQMRVLELDGYRMMYDDGKIKK